MVRRWSIQRGRGFRWAYISSRWTGKIGHIPQAHSHFEGVACTLVGRLGGLEAERRCRVVEEAWIWVKHDRRREVVEEEKCKVTMCT